MEVCADRKQIQAVNASLGDGAMRMARVMPTVYGFPWVFRRVVEQNQPVFFSSLEKLPSETKEKRDFWENSGIEAMLMVPLHFRGEVTHLIGLANSSYGREWPENSPRRLLLFGEMIVRVLIHQSDREALLRRERELAGALRENEKLKEQWEPKEKPLREEVKSPNQFRKIIGVSDLLKYVLFMVRQVADAKTTVLLMGETGTGKGLLAHALHEMSGRRNKPLVKVNCAGLPPNLIESELFGREKGAFTGSTARQIGRFELANGGTIFLDEIGELPLELQAKLLKVLDDEEFERLGNPHTIKVDVRIIASTNKNLEEEIEKGRFRKDLFYRLNVFSITIPPLRERKQDIPLLVKFYLEKFARIHGKGTQQVSENRMKALENYSWPGNVRELINTIERAVIMSDGAELRLEEQLDAMLFDYAEKQVPGGVVETEREHILATIQEMGWRIEGRNGAAQFLGMNPSTLRYRMKKLGIMRPHKYRDPSL